jgi:ATP-dependent RNA helicase RhlE
MPFSSFPLHADLLRGVKELGFTRPTPIQEQAIPPAAEGRDILACARKLRGGARVGFATPQSGRVGASPQGKAQKKVLTSLIVGD